MPKLRIDLALVEKRLAESRALAQRLVMAGEVRINGQVALKPSQTVAPTDRLEVIQRMRFVSRGGEKLRAALEAFPVAVAGRVCADVGASTGGFTDCLLQNGAARVYAIDVGEGILHWKLRGDRRVVVMEGVNARQVERLPEAVGLATIDASFISLKLLIPVVCGWFEPGAAEIIALVKPQFEAGRNLAARGDGVIRDPAVHRQVLLDVLAFAGQAGLAARGLLRSPLTGPKGNVEFLAWLAAGPAEAQAAAGLVEAALPRATTDDSSQDERNNGDQADADH
jgi:23S rRNA (cytidine1920-2'-O)/16S rRNA (cytidine1409-2'-O)-methyltransferase